MKNTLCASGALQEGADVWPFEVFYNKQVVRAFAVRFDGQVYAYLNQCTHVAIELDFQPNRIFDDSGQWLLCATHGAVYHPESGACSGGPCQGGLVKIKLTEEAGMVYWHTAENMLSVPD